MNKRYAIGIDLGTSNSALAIASLDNDAAAQPVPVAQILNRKAIGSLNTLPSVLYLPTEAEQKSLPQLPWPADATLCCGQHAREQGAQLPERQINSAKSWLCHAHADPMQALLPWQSPLEERKLSPFTAQKLYLEHLRHNLLYQSRQQGWNLQPENCQITLTVPASFDEMARLLTAEAAEAAGWGEVTLLEEQQAAFYHWLAGQGNDWRNQVQAGDIILVCDIGGGTSDFSLIAVTSQQGQLHLERISVGDHLLLGGDNMDLALAWTLRTELEQNGKSLDNSQFLSLIQSCRQGKEALLSDPSLGHYPIAIASRGASLFARSLSVQLHRSQVEQILFDGFLPLCPITSQPEDGPVSGLEEIGLHYARDPVLSRHLAQFLVHSYRNAQSKPELAAQVREHCFEQDGVSFLFPTAVLFNGGLFNAAAIRRRLCELLRNFAPQQPLRLLQESSPDLAVAQGAASYGRTLVRGEGIRIKAGSARSYYLGLQSAMPAVPGLKPQMKAICVVPQGMEEGTELRLEGRDFGLVTGQMVEFRFFCSSQRAGDTMGTQVDNMDELEECARLEISLPAQQQQQRVPVQLLSRITELGTLELWMQHKTSDQRWKIEFNLRQQP
ncbi:MAG: Hsp70 family protein [Desulfuromonadaceae bacterium]|nr:Hsp70 family protein [Desulfuromonadaceae bacterium]